MASGLVNGVTETAARRRLEQRIAVLQRVCAEAYQLAGAVGAPVAALDNLSAAASGRPIPHGTFLPVSVGTATPSLPRIRPVCRRRTREGEDAIEARPARSWSSRAAGAPGPRPARGAGSRARSGGGCRVSVGCVRRWPGGVRGRSRAVHRACRRFRSTTRASAPVVREALDSEAGRLGMSREALCRAVLEEVARKVAHACEPGVDSDTSPAIPLAYIGAEDPDSDPLPSSESEPVAAAAVAGDDPPSEPDADSSSPARALLPVPGAALAAAPRRRRVRRLPRLRVRARRSRWVVAVSSLVAVAALTLAAVAVSLRYEVAGSGVDGLFVLDRWRGVVWRCGDAGVSGPPVCAVAAFRQRGDGRGAVASLGRLAP